MPVKMQQIITEDVSAAQLQAYAFGTLQQLGWRVVFAVESILVAYTIGGWGRGKDEIFIETLDGRICISSKFGHYNWPDLTARNKKNLAAFLRAFNSIRTSATAGDCTRWNNALDSLLQSSRMAVESV